MTRRLQALVCAAMLAAITSTPSDAASRNRIIAFKDDPHARHMPRYEPQYAPCCGPGIGKYTPRKKPKKKPKKYKLKEWVAPAHRAKAPPVQQWGGSDLVVRAKQYMGTNPTGWGRLWCGRFMAMIAPEAAQRVGNPNLARNWAKLPRTGLRVGAIAVLSRGRGGHVGVVSGIDRNGNPIIVSGNSRGRKVGEGVYPRHRVLAYVTP